MNNKELRNCLGLFATGVVVACARRKNFLSNKKIPVENFLSKTSLGKSLLSKLKDVFADQFFGMTINSFSSVSMDPPLVQFSVDNKSANLPLFKKNRSFSLNILSQDQMELAKAFATPKNSKKWGVETYVFGKSGNPIFENSLGYFECKKHKMIKAGDHHIIIGEILDYGQIKDEKPLVYYKGAFNSVEKPS